MEKKQPVRAMGDHGGDNGNHGHARYSGVEENEGEVNHVSHRYANACLYLVQVQLLGKLWQVRGLFIW